MGRKKNDVGTWTVTISTTPQVEVYLKRLITSGLFGKNTAEAARRVLESALEAKFEAGKVVVDRK